MKGLRLVEPNPPAPLPSAQTLAVESRRPGELHDVLAVGSRAEPIAGKARAAGIGFSVATTLLLELQLLSSDLDASGETLEPPPATTPQRQLAAAEAAYLRALCFRRPGLAIPAPRAAVPVRLFPRLSREVIEASVELDLEQAIAWEIAAMLDGRTVGELGLLLAAQQSRRR